MSEIRRFCNPCNPCAWGWVTLKPAWILGCDPVTLVTLYLVKKKRAGVPPCRHTPARRNVAKVEKTGLQGYKRNKCRKSLIYKDKFVTQAAYFLSTRVTRVTFTFRHFSLLGAAC